MKQTTKHKQVTLVYTKGDCVFVCSGRYKNAFFAVDRDAPNEFYWCRPLNAKEAEKVGLKSFDEVLIQWQEMEYCKVK